MISEFPKPARLPKPVKITEQVWPDGTVPVVSIRCITYQHVNFIRDAIEGFLMQETTFPVEIVIHDDASTDGTAEIIREYEARHPRLFRAVYQRENQYSKGPDGKKVMREAMRQLTRGEFIALCEGDDYWTSPNKLQRQVEVLENDPSLSLCFHNAWIEVTVEGVEKRSLMLVREIKEYHGIVDILKGWYIPTASMVFRNYLNFFQPDWTLRCQSGDMVLHLFLGLRGKFKYLKNPMSIYRRHDGGISNSHQGYNKALSMLFMYRKFNDYTGRKHQDQVVQAIARELRGHWPGFDDLVSKPILASWNDGAKIDASAEVITAEERGRQLAIYGEEQFVELCEYVKAFLRFEVSERLVSLSDRMGKSKRVLRSIAALRSIEHITPLSSKARLRLVMRRFQLRSGINIADPLLTFRRVLLPLFSRSASR